MESAVQRLHSAVNIRSNFVIPASPEILLPREERSARAELTSPPEILSPREERTVQRKLQGWMHTAKTAFLRNAYTESFGDKPFNGKRYNGAFNLSGLQGEFALAHAIAYIPRVFFNHPLFPNSDKLSDFGAPTYEPIVFTRMMKAAVNASAYVANTLLKPFNRDIFLYDSMTHRELATAALWYGTLWVTSEIAAIHAMHPLRYTTADPGDIPAEAGGTLLAYTLGRQAIKSIPIGRFADIERSVEMRLRKMEAKDKGYKQKIVDSLAQSLSGKGGNQRESSKAFLRAYKETCMIIKGDILKRTADVRGMIKKDPEQLKLYDNLVRNYTFALARDWYLGKLAATHQGQVPPPKDVRQLTYHHKIRMHEKRDTTIAAARKYRQRLIPQ